MPTEVWGLRTGSPGGGCRASPAIGSVERSARVWTLRDCWCCRSCPCRGRVGRWNGARGNVYPGCVYCAGFAGGSVEFAVAVGVLRVWSPGGGVLLSPCNRQHRSGPGLLCGPCGRQRITLGQGLGVAVLRVVADAVLGASAVRVADACHGACERIRLAWS